MGATKRALLAQMDADEERKGALIQLAREGNEYASNDLWREFGLIVDPADELDAEAYTSMCHAIEKPEPPCKPVAAGISLWVPADKELPGNPRCVLATDLEAHFIAVWEDETWTNAHTSEPIDSVITHWMELPEVPE